MPQASALTETKYLADIRQQMLRFARLQLGDAHAAEDAVQEALMAALANSRQFQGRSALKTWVFGILKRKIIDIFRQRQRLINASDLPSADEADSGLDALFDTRGMWQPEHRPQPWGAPEDAVAQQQFWLVFEACLEGLPPTHARVFMMREFLELDTAETCAAAGITSENLYVLLHRARLRLRECLEHQWFAGEGGCDAQLSRHHPTAFRVARTPADAARAHGAAPARHDVFRLPPLRAADAIPARLGR